MPRKRAKLSQEALDRQNAAIKAWHADNMAYITVNVRKDVKEKFRRLADARGSSLRSLIIGLLEAECQKDGIE